MRTIGIASIIALLAGSLTMGPARAQEDVWVPELPLTRDTGVSARALGMGGAYLALSDDGAALRYNPAGLARVGRIEFSGSLIDRGIDIETRDHGNLSSADETKARIAGLSFVYPFPTYRGSMVIGLGYHVPHLLDRNYLRSGTWNGNTREEQLYEEGAVGEWSFGYAVDMSPTLSVGVRATRIYGTRFQDWTYASTLFSNPVHDVSDLTVSGFTASLGALVQVTPWSQMGLVLDLPRWLHNEADFGDFIIEEDMTLPFSVGAGFAASFRKLLLSADARMTDWTQIDYEGPLRYYDQGGNRQQAYRRVWDLRVGAEYLLDLSTDLPLRLRAGFAREPLPYRVVFEEIDADGDPVYSKGRMDPDRSCLTFGAGVLLAQSMTIDLAYATGSFTRKGATLVESEEERRLLVTASFRLN
jgi:hypothetical protein